VKTQNKNFPQKTNLRMRQYVANIGLRLHCGLS